MASGEHWTQTGPLDFEDTRNQGNRRRGGASAPPRTRLGVPPSKFCSARYRHFENLVSRKIQSLRNPESIKYSVLFIVRLSLSTIPCLPVCLNAKYQSTPPPPHPSHSIAACLSLFSALFTHVHIKYRTSEQVDRQGSQCQTKTMLCWTGWADTPVNLFPTNPRPCHWCPHPRLRAAQYYLTRPRLALVSFCFTSFPTPRYL